MPFIKLLKRPYEGRIGNMAPEYSAFRERERERIVAAEFTIFRVSGRRL